MNYTIREYSLLALGLLTAVWFFVGYPSQDPRSSIDLSMDAESVLQKATQTMDDWGYASREFRSKVHFDNNRQLLDTLQYTVGRAELTEQLQGEKLSNLHAFYWETQFLHLPEYRKDRTGASTSGGEREPPDEYNETIQLRFNTQGDLMELVNSLPILPAKNVNRQALRASLFPNQRKNGTQQWLSTAADSALVKRTVIDLQGRANSRLSADEGRTDSSTDQPNTIRLSKEHIFRMAQFYLDRSGWNTSNLQPDTVTTDYLEGIQTATVRYRLSDTTFSPPPEIAVHITATGALISLNTSYEYAGSNDGFHELWPVLRNVLIFLFCLVGIIIFFFRIRARAIDTKPALIMGVLGGLGVSVSVLLGTVPEVDFFGDPDYWTITILVLLVVGVSGAAASLVFFVFTAIGDSITRQHWSNKLSILDYLRRGMIFNQPMGLMLIRSVLCAFILAGIWTTILWVLPHLYVDIQRVFIHGQIIWPPLYLLLSHGWIALSVVLGIFLVLGGQAYALTKNRLISLALMVLAFAIIVPITGSYGPVMQEMIAAAVIGIALSLIYLQWDAVTLFLSFFLFTGLLSTAPGWIVDGSPDYYIFLSFLLFLGALFIVGFWALSRGREEKTLSPFIPEYVEELAQEERIKQELQIARDVQQSFLPVKTPRFEKLDLAAMCKPAYETGGDYYDVIPLDEHRVAVTIGDVSGKGIQAAFYMTFVKGILHSLCREIESPAELLKKANRLFCDNAPRGVFISLVYGIIDLQRQEFYFARAGHNPILHINKRTQQVKELQPRGIGIGLDNGRSFDANIEEVTLTFGQEDVLVLYTDGIVEALNSNQTFYGTHRLNNLLSKSDSTTAAEMLQVLSDDLKTYVGEAKQHDDMTMVVMKLKA